MRGCECEPREGVCQAMLLLALHLATAALEPAVPPSRPAQVAVLPDGGSKKKGGDRDDEDAR